ncbi:hypothetical protein L484_014949 [Morus notabilis]|uniref:Uncharacterized protein n=1 Tax=Morus notabilis TaxID=981085 RepID=W9R7D2_9ROSA|nr:hypothetical protein L484_014949 [Morus notabilis]
MMADILVGTAKDLPRGFTEDPSPDIVVGSLFLVAVGGYHQKIGRLPSTFGIFDITTDYLQYYSRITLNVSDGCFASSRCHRLVVGAAIWSEKQRKKQERGRREKGAV